jgi:hypothetical protein
MFGIVFPFQDWLGHHGFDLEMTLWMILYGNESVSMFHQPTLRKWCRRRRNGKLTMVQQQNHRRRHRRQSLYQHALIQLVMIASSSHHKIWRNPLMLVTVFTFPWVTQS